MAQTQGRHAAATRQKQTDREDRQASHLSVGKAGREERREAGETQNLSLILSTIPATTTYRGFYYLHSSSILSLRQETGKRRGRRKQTVETSEKEKDRRRKEKLLPSFSSSSLGGGRRRKEELEHWETASDFVWKTWV